MKGAEMLEPAAQRGANRLAAIGLVRRRTRKKVGAPAPRRAARRDRSARETASRRSWPCENANAPARDV
jgi:hypothetical protein